MGLYLFPAFSGSYLVRLFWLLAAVNCVAVAFVVLVTPGRISWASHGATYPETMIGD